MPLVYAAILLQLPWQCHARSLYLFILGGTKEGEAMSDCSTRAFKVPKPELLPCPLCGGKAILHADQLAVDPAPMYYTIYCPSCKLKLTKAGYMSDKEAIKVWNTRYQTTCHNTNDPNARNWNCSRCGESFVVNAADSEPFKYCPGCGAKVVE